MTYKELTERLRAVGADEAEAEARIIFRELSGFSGAQIFLGGCEIDEALLLPVIERRALGEPLQYILGKCYFYNEEYEVSPAVLIPRQDTEILVDYAVKNIPNGENILDLCTGSGCIGISTLKNTKDTTALLCDISEAALSVAISNAKRNGVSERVKTVCADVLAELPSGEFFAVLSNPPYVTSEAYKKLAREIYFEPKEAFLGGEGGLVFYRSLIPRLASRLKRGGFIAFEIGFDQGEAVMSLGREYGFQAELLRDLSGCDRVVILRK